MHMLTIAFGGMGMAWKFGFKTAETAEAAWVAATNSGQNTFTQTVATFEIKDDFGQRGKFSTDKVTGILLEDLDEVKVLHVENMIHGAKTQAAAQARAQGDPMLKLAGMNGPGGGPAMIRPMM